MSKLDQKTYVLNTGLFLSIKLKVELVAFPARFSIFLFTYLYKFEDEKDEKYRKSNKF